MGNDERRITLVGRHKQMTQRTWVSSNEAANRIVMLDSFTMLRSTVLSPLVKSDADVDRIVLDRSCSESEFLALLAELPQEFSGDLRWMKGFAGLGGEHQIFARPHVAHREPFGSLSNFVLAEHGDDAGGAAVRPGGCCPSSSWV